MSLATPKHRASLWVLANICWITVVPATALYFDRQLRRGAYPVDADSIGIPILGIATWVVTLLLPINFVWWFLLRRYPGRVSLCPPGKGLATHSQVIGALGLICALACAAAGILGARPKIEF